MKPKRVQVEVVPRSVTFLARAIEEGKLIASGQNSGKTWALQIASAKRINKKP